MRPTATRVLAGVTLALALVPVPTMAQDKGWYAGFGVGVSTANDACHAIAGLSLDCGGQETAFRILGAYRFNGNFAAEVGYVDLGMSSTSFVSVGPTGSGTVSLKASGVEVVAVGSVPLGSGWSLLGKLGAFLWDVDFRDGTGLAGNSSESGTSPTFGIGAHYDFSRSMAARLEYQVYPDIGEENTTGTRDVTMFGVSLISKF